MGRAVGSPLAVINIALYVSEDWVFKQDRRRYVFTDMVSARVRQLSKRVHGSLRLYSSFHATLSKGLYSTKVIYGMRAIDIDKPLRDGIAVSIRLKITIGEGEDSYERTALYPE